MIDHGLSEAPEYEGFDSPLENLVLDEGHCFLCGTTIQQASAEHVIPKWLLRRHDLWNERLTLLNGSTLPYKQLTIPCCPPCNNEHLSTLERTVADAFSSGYEAVYQLPPVVLFQWAAKIFFGILYREKSLLLDRKNPAAGVIAPRGLLENLSNLHGMLQTIRRPTRFVGEPFFSVLVADLHESPDEDAFDLIDSSMMVLAVRSGPVGVIIALQDQGVTAATYGRLLEDIRSERLHPLQFEELVARTVSQLSLKDGVPRFMWSMEKGSPDLTLRSLPTGFFMNEEDPERLAYFLHWIWRRRGMKYDEILQPDGSVLTSLLASRGAVQIRDQWGQSIRTIRKSDGRTSERRSEK